MADDGGFKTFSAFAKAVHGASTGGPVDPRLKVDPTAPPEPMLTEQQVEQLEAFAENLERRNACAAWLKTRPESVQRLAAEFPIGTAFALGGRTLYLVGYNEDDSLLVSATDPSKDYETAIRTKQRLCASHVREGGKHG